MAWICLVARRTSATGRSGKYGTSQEVQMEIVSGATPRG
jgi:hypothetical protein